MSVLTADKAPLEIPCGECGKKTKVMIGKIEKEGGITCKSCGCRTDVEVTPVQLTMDDLNAAIKRR